MRGGTRSEKEMQKWGFKEMRWMRKKGKNAERLKEKVRQNQRKRGREEEQRQRGVKDEVWKARREGVDFAGESVSSPLRIPVRTWLPFRNTLRVCMFELVVIATMWGL